MLAPASLLALLAILLGIALWGLQTQDQTMDNALHLIAQKSKLLAVVERDSTAAHAQTYRFFTHLGTTRITPPEYEAQQIMLKMNNVLNALNELERISTSQAERKLVHKSTELAQAYSRRLQDTIGIALLPTRPDSTQLMEQAERTFVQLTLGLDLLQRAQDTTLEDSYSDLKKQTKHMLITLFCLGAGAVLIFLSRIMGQSHSQAEAKRRTLLMFNNELEKNVEERTRELEKQLAKVSLLNTQLLDTRQEQMTAETRYKDLFENATEGIFQVTPQGKIISANLALANILGYPSAEALCTDVHDFNHRLYAQKAQRLEIQNLLETTGGISQFEFLAIRVDGEEVWLSITARVVYAEDDSVLRYEGTLQEITQRKNAEANLVKTQTELVQTARQAGMAEVATNVLHNVGNVLNSINVSADFISNILRRSKTDGFNKGVALLSEHKNNLASYLTEDNKGKLLPDYLNKIALALNNEQKEILNEVNQLNKCINHVKEIVATQQHYATRNTSVKQFENVAELVEDAIRLNSGSLSRHHVSIETNILPMPRIAVDKSRILQILVNLISNSKQAISAAAQDRNIVISAQLIHQITQHHLQIRVEDHGDGISEENLTRIFAHGFTTRATGHGFGLHSSINAAQEMGGTLSAFSAGVGQGACFTLDLPVDIEKSQDPSTSNKVFAYN